MIMLKIAQRRSIGLNHFWKWNLPTLKFHNENIDFVVTRIQPETDEDYPKIPSAIFVHKAGDKMTRVECNGKTHEWILKNLVSATGATRVPVEDIPHIPLPKVRLQ
ncbi:hypothetical protein METBIDRAFT_30437 [Metschnikowia bicuspidata var. bicuspidata NRRL YB-4993]|uniref:Ribosomal protein/NADH dehydrogenase domain-containing protein n=1 Tax=Metschnikowia bicuspidata var. bicuspidata NRRL YB-4993 TaxID=869754 RepID=A0A1A0HJ93_9ASCO|nr:hypothetical protein METBIDRAFT_30437 [Metschnikowia bicuspidata var. bicuspidata NRRL YB-4993]OBA24085.1 hypothetical protein METBIDRAFT_30437 [Metschnikowia bicuspidata var. bicuspidata NRRL YB-4993]